MKREEAKDLFRKDKDAYGKPKSIMHKIDLIYNDFESQDKKEYLADVEWGWIGHTKEYSALKKDMGDVCHDVVDAACIDEIVIMDILTTLRLHGYEVIKVDENAPYKESKLK